MFVAAVCCTSIMLTGCSGSQLSTTQEKVAQVFAKHVDTYTTASKTKTFLKIEEAADTLTAISSDLASLADTLLDGYERIENAKTVQLMSVNPDGCPGLSSIRAWKYTKVDDGNDQITVQLTDGQTAQNLKEQGSRGTLLVEADGHYLVHVETVAGDVLEYSDEAYEAGHFNAYYDGAKEKASQYNLTFDVLSIEQSSSLELE